MGSAKAKGGHFCLCVNVCGVLFCGYYKKFNPVEGHPN